MRYISEAVLSLPSWRVATSVHKERQVFGQVFHLDAEYGFESEFRLKDLNTLASRVVRKRLFPGDPPDEIRNCGIPKILSWLRGDDPGQYIPCDGAYIGNCV
jgi:hypothetical protein